MLGTDIMFIPNLTGVFGRVFRPYRTLMRTLVGNLPRKYPRYTLVRPQHPAERTLWPRDRHTKRYYCGEPQESINAVPKLRADGSKIRRFRIFPQQQHLKRFFSKCKSALFSLRAQTKAVKRCRFWLVCEADRSAAFFCVCFASLAPLRSPISLYFPAP